MGLPVPHRSIFFVKLAESMFYSSWAFAILSLPIFVSYGLVRSVPVWFYLGIAALVLPFLVIPAGIGALLTMLLSALLPARRALKWTVALIAVAIAGSVALVRFSGLQPRLLAGSVESFTQILNLLKLGSNLWSPHYWVTRGMLALGEGRWGEALYWFALIVSTALMLLQVCAWLAPALYYRGWCLANETGGARNNRFAVGRIVFDFIERRLRFLGQPTRALVMKDIKTFWRDPAQWSQLIILFGLLFIYVANLRTASMRAFAFSAILPFWQSLVSFFNMGATCFILSILTTRFVYPMLSLEGKQYWVVGLAPMSRTRVVWQKYGLCCVSSLVATEILMVLSNRMLGVSGSMMILSTVTLFLMAFGLTSLAVGLGAATPNFREDNPARIANGLGGTLNVILSLIYIGAIVALEIFPGTFAVQGVLPHGGRTIAIAAACVGATIAVHATAIVVPMRIGLARWKKMEF
jgi:ABC-2 type transport system permease protein